MKLLQKIGQELIPFSNKHKLVLLLIIVTVFQFALFYAPALADEAVEQINQEEEMVSLGSFVKNEFADEEITRMIVESRTTQEEGVTVVRTSVHTMTAYNSEVGQTDDSPCITANNFNVCEHGIEDTIAANFLKFGTKVRIPELFGDRVFIVRDRMNKRYTSRVDIWMLERSDALQFGLKTARIEVIE